MTKRLVTEPGTRYNSLVILNEDRRENGHTYVRCRCDCGNETIATMNNLRRNHTRTCGCSRQGPSKKQHRGSPPIGSVFGRLTVLEHLPIVTGQGACCRCQCSCGNKTDVRSYQLKKGMTRSCGCYSNEVRGQSTKTHGMSKSPEYNIWRGMLTRCYDKKSKAYPDYGGRGITVCERWHDFSNFIADVGLRPSDEYSLDRQDVDKGYSPENTRWTTREIQANNKRKTKRYKYFGQDLTITEWCKFVRNPYYLVRQRIERDGYTPFEALFLGYRRWSKPKSKRDAGDQAVKEELSDVDVPAELLAATAPAGADASAESAHPCASA